MKLYLYSILIILISCSSGNEDSSRVSSNPKINKTDPISLTFYDSLELELRFDTTSCMSEAEFHPLYIGNLSDSIYLNYNPYLLSQRADDYHIYPSPLSDSLEIIIDTTQYIASK